MLDKKQFDKILNDTIAGLGFEYICAEIISSNKIIRIFIDKNIDTVNNTANSIANGITIDDCKFVSNHINRVLDVEFKNLSNYRLEISSPGMDRPLVTIQHFAKFIGKKIKIKLNNNLPNTEQRNLTGYIKEVKDDEQIIIINNIDHNVIYNINFVEIDKANLIPQWDKINN